MHRAAAAAAAAAFGYTAAWAPAGPAALGVRRLMVIALARDRYGNPSRVNLFTSFARSPSHERQKERRRDGLKETF